MVVSTETRTWEHMTQALARSVEADQTIPAQHGLPEPTGSVVFRTRLAERLTVGSQGLLTAVEAPTGAGKTLGVGSWAAQAASADGVLWLNAGSYTLDATTFWSRFRSSLLDLGAGPLPAVPSPHGADSLWASWLIKFADALRVGGKWIVVLDDYPTGPVNRLGQQLAALCSRTGRAVRLVLVSTRSPAFDPRGIRVAGEFSHIGAEVLRMDEREVAEMLTLRDVTPDAATVSSVWAWSEGWACGVGLAAQALQTSSWPEAVDGLNLALDQLLNRKVMAQLPAAGRELIFRTSVATEVTSGMARAVMGVDVRSSTGLVGCQNGFVDVRPDGSFRCHPLLRRSALRRLDEDWPALALEARRTAAGWYLENGEGSAGIELAVGVGEWSWVASALVRSLAVPGILLGDSNGISPSAAERDEVWTAEPLIAAAVAVQQGNLHEAEAALTRAGEKLATDREPELARLLTESLIRMAMSRQRSDCEAGLRWVAHCRQLAAELSAAQKLAAPELSRLLDAYQGAFLLWSGDLDRASAVLEPATQTAAVRGPDSVAAAECTGLLAWPEALRGNLTSAARHTAEVLRMRPANADEIGVGYAQLAAAWVHLERSELSQARQRLDHASCHGKRPHEPWLAAAQRLAAARLETAGGDPDAALRMLGSVRRTQHSASAGWLADRFTVAVAEAHLAAADPQRALAALTPEPTQAVVEARVLAAAARRAIGDKRGARALLTAVENRVSEAPLPVAVQVWILEAQLAVDAMDNERARSLVRRALRAATREDLRLALGLVRPWLTAFVERGPELSRSYRSLVSPLITSTPDRRTVEPTGSSRGVPTTVLLEPLTERELQILERLAYLCTTEEIATDLFVSMNTVKTHIKSLFLKLSVNRRADAVRRGRELGLC
jgi:LuxR family transcriptional regulator, maltose regulon positive regulatory protein